MTQRTVKQIWIGDSHLLPHNNVPSCYADIVKERGMEGVKFSAPPILDYLQSGRKFWNSWVNRAIQRIRDTWEPTVYVLCCGTNNLRNDASKEGVAIIAGFHARFVDAILETDKTALCIVSPLPDNKKFTDGPGDKLDKVLKKMCLGREVYTAKEERDERFVFEEVRRGVERVSTYQKSEEGVRDKEEGRRVEKVFTHQKSEEGFRDEEREKFVQEKVKYVRFRTKKLPHFHGSTHYRPELFKDDVHINQTGARMLATELFNIQTNFPKKIFGWEPKPITNPVKINNIIENQYMGMTKEAFDRHLETMLKERREAVTRQHRRHHLGVYNTHAKKQSF